MSEFTQVGDAMAEAAAKLTKRPHVTVTPPTRDEIVVTTLRHAGVPDRYRDARFANWRATEGTRRALSAAQKVAAKPANLVLVGPWGCGKTRLAASILAARVERWLDAYPSEIVDEGPEGITPRPRFASRFASVPTLLDDIRRSYQYADEPDPLVSLRGVPMLVLDDLGREKATDWVLERLYVLIDERYGHKLPTVVTTNYSLDELAHRDYGAMVSRLTETGTVVKITAADQRPGDTA